MKGKRGNNANTGQGGGKSRSPVHFTSGLGTDRDRTDSATNRVNRVNPVIRFVSLGKPHASRFTDNLRDTREFRRDVRRIV